MVNMEKRLGVMFCFEFKQRKHFLTFKPYNLYCVAAGPSRPKTHKCPKIIGNVLKCPKIGPTTSTQPVMYVTTVSPRLR